MVCRYTGSGQVWDCARSSATSDSITRAGVTGFSDWAVGNNVGPTAVQLVPFTATAMGAEVTLDWQTASEMDVLGFNVYRAAVAAGPYTRINAALIPAQGDAMVGASYRFVDRPGMGVHHDRLEDVALSGAAHLHPPVRVEVAASLRLYLPLVTR